MCPSPLIDIVLAYHLWVFEAAQKLPTAPCVTGQWSWLWAWPTVDTGSRVLSWDRFDCDT